MKSAPAKFLLQRAIGREYQNGTHCWEMLDDLFELWPHVIAGAGIAFTALTAYYAGSAHNAVGSLCLVGLQLVIRTGFKLAYDKKGQQPDLDHWLGLFWIAATISGVLWGAALAVLLPGAPLPTQVMVLTVGCAVVQAASTRAYMAPLQSLTQSAILLSIVVTAAVAEGHIFLLTLAALLVCYQIGQIRKLIGLRLSQLASEAQRLELVHQLAAKANALERANAQLIYHAATDELTGLPNRRQFDRYLSRLLAEAERDGTSLSLAIIDVDHFKQFNDSYGHVAGDECLAVVGTVLKEFGDLSSSIAARYGGEEFAIIMPGTDEQKAVLLSEQLRQMIEVMDMSVITGKPGKITISTGIATHSGKGRMHAEQLILSADSGLYEAKRSGRNRVCVSGKTDA